MATRAFAIRRALGWLWPPLTFLALSLLMTWPLAANLGARLPGTGDALLQTWSLAWNAHILRIDPGAIWQAPIFFPYPDTAAYQDNHLVLSLVGAPMIWLTGNPILAHNLLLLLSFVITGWATFLLARDVAAATTPAAPPSVLNWAAFLAGCGVAFSAYRMAHLIHLNLLQQGWLIFALFFLRRLLRPREAGGGRWRDAALLGLFAGLQVATAVYYAFFAVLVLGGYVALWALGLLWQRLRRGRSLPWTMLGRLGLAGLVAGVVALPVMLPYLRLYRTLGIVRSPAELENWSAPLRAYAAVVANNRLYGPLGEIVVESGELILFPGLLLATLGLAGLALGLWDQRQGRPNGGDRPFWALLVAGAALLSFGTAIRLVRYGEPLPIPTPYLLLYSYLPGFGSLRVPARWGWLVTLALAMLAAITAVRLLTRVRSRWQPALGAALVAVVLAEQAAFPVPLSPPPLANVPPVYSWLGQPAQADLRTVIELPVGATPRGEELDRITWRQFYGMAHWKNLPVAYGGLIPFGTTELLRRLQALPDPAVIGYLQLIGVDTLVLHRDEYQPAELASLLRGLDELPELSRRAEVGASLVYTIASPPELTLPPGTLFVSADERMPGLPVLGLIRRWQAEGRSLYGPGRLRFYGPLAEPQPGQVAEFGLLAADEDPATHGYNPAGRLWERQGLTLYRRDPELLASAALGTAPPGQFHPAYPAALELVPRAGGLRAGELDLSWADSASPRAVELDVASLGSTITVDGSPLDLPPGLSTLRLPLPTGATLRLDGQPGRVALLRLRALTTGGEREVRSRPGLAASAEAILGGTRLSVTVQAAGDEAVRLRVQGAAARDDRPVYLLEGDLPLPAAGGTVTFVTDLLRPSSPWLDGSEPAQDGRYILYIQGSAEGALGTPVAQFQIRDGQVTAFTSVPLPLSEVP